MNVGSFHQDRQEIFGSQETVTELIAYTYGSPRIKCGVTGLLSLCVMFLYKAPRQVRGDRIRSVFRFLRLQSFGFLTVICCFPSVIPHPDAGSGLGGVDPDTG